MICDIDRSSCSINFVRCANFVSSNTVRSQAAQACKTSIDLCTCSGIEVTWLSLGNNYKLWLKMITPSGVTACKRLPLICNHTCLAFWGGWSLIYGRVECMTMVQHKNSSHLNSCKESKLSWSSSSESDISTKLLELYACKRSKYKITIVTDY